MKKYFPFVIIKRGSSLSQIEVECVVDFLIHQHSFLFDKLISYKDPTTHRLCTLLVYLATTYYLTDDLVGVLSNQDFYERSHNRTTESPLEVILHDHYCDVWASFEDYRDNLKGWIEFHDETREITDHLTDHEFIREVIKGLVEICCHYHSHNTEL